MFKFELSEALTNVILEALAQQPLAKSFDAFVSMRSQMAQQRQVVQTQPPLQGGQGVGDVPKANGAVSE